MQAEFWHNKWANNDIGFHEGQVNSLLLAHFPALELASGSRVFLPLCGKTRDIAWLLSQGYCVAGAELSELAIQQLFDELGVTPAIRQHGDLLCYQAENLAIWVGDVFALQADELGSVDAVYDRAALVALPPELRARYTRHIQSLCANAPQLLICYDYDQQAMAGPPFAIRDAEVQQHYGAVYQLQLLESRAVPGGMRGQCPAQEKVWLLARAG